MPSLRFSLISLFLLVATTSARADEYASYRYDPAADLSITAISGLIGLGGYALSNEIDGPVPGSSDDVFVLDRRIARLARTSEGAATASDIVLGSGVLFAGLATWFAPVEGAGSIARRERARRIGVLVETLSLANGLNFVVKVAARRPRPFTYAPAYDGSEGHLDDQLSFYSGHATLIASAITAATYISLAKTGRRRLGFAMLGVGSASALSVAYLRVRAGRHFPTDVLTGLIVGASLGVLVPHLHLRSRVSLSVEPVRGGGVATISGWLH